MDYALLIVRVMCGLFFAISGYHKLFNPVRHQSLVDTLVQNRIPYPQFNQWFVPTIEFTAGLGLIGGCLTTLSAFGLFIICVVATCTDGYKRVLGWKPLDKADALDDILYLPEVTYILLLWVVIIGGSGYLSIDSLLFN